MAQSQKKALQFKPTMEALGVVLAFICRSAPYSEFRAAKIIKAVQHQLSTGCHACLIEDERLVAYAGWMPVSVREAEQWLDVGASLRPATPAAADAAALTVVSALSKAHIPILIRACRKLAPGRTVYFKRDYAGGRSRRSKVYNRP